LLTRRFGTFWLASLLSNIGTWAQQVAQPWLLLSLGASPWLLGLDSFALGGPGLLLTLVGGVLADRADRRRLIAVLQSIQMLCPLLIVGLLLHGPSSPGSSWRCRWWWGDGRPVHALLPDHRLDAGGPPAAAHRHCAQHHAVQPLAHPGAVAGRGADGQHRRGGAFAVSAASYLPFIAVALWILPRATVRAVAPAEGGGDGQLLAGARAVLAQPALRGAVLTVLVGSLLCSPLLTFCPVLVRTVFQADVAQFSLTVSAFGLGGLLGACC
jgi:predicted MFS family arabinose efflux permease